jgi:hypothetical protein
VDSGRYPEAEAAGSLFAVVRDLLGPDVHVEEKQSWRGANALVRGGERSVDVTLAANERLFLLQFWARRVHYASGKTADLAAAAGAARDWVSGATTDAMTSAWPFAAFGEWAKACERGEATEHSWQGYFADRHRAPQLRAMSRVIELAMEEPLLRSLHPFFSHDTLGFRPSVEPVAALGVWVTPVREGGFVVRDPQRREVRVPDAEAAVARVVSLLSRTG